PGEAFSGRPCWPYRRQVEGRIWYAPPAPELGLTARKLPPDSHITTACGIAHCPSQLETVCCACWAETCCACSTCCCQVETWDCRLESALCSCWRAESRATACASALVRTAEISSRAAATRWS